MAFWSKSETGGGAEGSALKEKKKMTAGEEAWDLAKTVFYAVAIALAAKSAARP